MSTSLLYHAYGVRGYRQVKMEFTEGAVIFHVMQPKKSHRCTACGSPKVIGRGHTLRRFRTLPMGKNESLWSCRCRGWNVRNAEPCGRSPSISPNRA